MHSWGQLMQWKRWNKFFNFSKKIQLEEFQRNIPLKCWSHCQGNTFKYGRWSLKISELPSWFWVSYKEKKEKVGFVISTTLMVSIPFIPCCSTITNKHWNMGLFIPAIPVYQYVLKKNKNQFRTYSLQRSYFKLLQINFLNYGFSAKIYS